MKIVFTNGCFDILHPGHIHLLKEAKKLGDILIVGIDSDHRVERLKGRCLNEAKDRKKMLKATKYVDEVYVFDSLIGLLQWVEPHILVKGGDYKAEEVVGREYVDEVVIIPLKKGYSTTKLIKKINEDSKNCNNRR